MLNPMIKEALRSLPEWLTCYVCGAPAVCIGRDEGESEEVAPSCDEHCGHGCIGLPACVLISDLPVLADKAEIKYLNEANDCLSRQVSQLRASLEAALVKAVETEKLYSECSKPMNLGVCLSFTQLIAGLKDA